MKSDFIKVRVTPEARKAAAQSAAARDKTISQLVREFLEGLAKADRR